MNCSEGRQRPSPPPSPVATGERLLPLPAVLDRTSHSRAGLYDAIKRDAFPKPIRISANRVAWPESVVAEWINAKIAEAA